jgi:hypothetical protein
VAPIVVLAQAIEYQGLASSSGKFLGRNTLVARGVLSSSSIQQTANPISTIWTIPERTVMVSNVASTARKPARSFLAALLASLSAFVA